MTQKRALGTGLCLVGVMIGGALAARAVAGSTGHKHGDHQPAKPTKSGELRKGCTQLERECLSHLSAALKAIDAASQAVETGDKKTTLAKLVEARKFVVASREAIEKRLTPTFINVKCPMMGTPIDPAKVPAKLTRLYKGKSVAFCCPGCPQAWDKLPDGEKPAKLVKVIAQKDHRETHQEKHEGPHAGHKH